MVNWSVKTDTQTSLQRLFVKNIIDIQAEFSKMADLLSASVYLISFLYLLSVFTSVKSGCVGDKGTSGARGQKGEVGDAGADWYDAPAPNWRQCTWNAGDGRDSGQIDYATCQIYKYSSSTSLYAAFSGNTRLYGCHGCCGRWYLTFNGAECSNPQKIEGTVYMAYYNSADLYRHRVIQGYCDGIGVGWVTVALVVGACSGYGYFDLYTGWNSISRLVVSEETAPMY